MNYEKLIEQLQARQGDSPSRRVRASRLMAKARWAMAGRPEAYLHVAELSSGEEWIRPLRGNSSLSLERQLRKWIKERFCGELALDGEIMPRLDGDYYGRIMTDSRTPDSIVCWQGGGFYLKEAR